MDLELNLLLVVIVVLGMWRVWRGLHNGLANEINRLVSLVAALFVLALSVMIIYGVMENNVGNIVTAVIVLIVTGLLIHLLNLVMKAFRAIVKLPIISFINHILGAAIGLAEIIVACWIMYCVIQIFTLGEVGRQIMLWTNESEWLMKLYESNWLLGFLTGESA